MHISDEERENLEIQTAKSKVRTPMTSKFVEGPNGFKIEYRFTETGALDELLFYHQNECLMHLEQTADDSWYLGWYLPGTEKNEHGITAPAHVVQTWFKSLYASSPLVDGKKGIQS